MTVYLLHFAAPVGRARHYVGSTHDARLQKRLIEHARGQGASLTARAVALGIDMYLARTFEGLDHNFERLKKRHGHYKTMCPLCCPMFAHLADEVRKLDPNRPEQPPLRAVLEWTTRSKSP